MVELIHNSAIIGPLVNKTWGILLHTQNCGSNELASQLLESLSPLIGLQWDLEMIYYLLLAWWKWSKLCLKINHQQSSVTFTGLRWLGTGRRGLSWHKRRAQCLPDEYLIWTHLETYSQFWFCLPVMATIQRFIRDVTLHFIQTLDKNYKIVSLCSVCPTGLGQIYSADSEWILIWIFLFGFWQIFSHDTKIFRIIHKCIIASFNGLWGL